MYTPLNEKSGVQAVNNWLASIAVQSGPDGVTLATPDAQQYPGGLGMPPRLRTWLTDLRLLRHIPIAYLVPDAALLPPESIRFFHLDRTWVDRVIDGVFSAANTGTVDFTFSYSLLQMVREALDKELLDIAKAKVPGTNWNAKTGQIRGLLIRSELARRWPDMIVQAFSNISNVSPVEIPILRSEPISRDLYIALVAGIPRMIHIREPFVGARFGVETTPQGGFEVDERTTNGDTTGASIGVTGDAKRVLNIKNLAAATGNTARMVGLHLEQRPYVQEFKDTRPEPRGSVPLTQYEINGVLQTVPLTKGRVMKLDKLKARLTQLQALEKA